MRSAYQLNEKIIQKILSRGIIDAIGIKEQVCFKTVKYRTIANFGFRLKVDDGSITVLRVGGEN
ncbi:MAG: hypothetical protein ACP5NC_01815 [Nitrososphaeria archaeon]